MSGGSPDVRSLQALHGLRIPGEVRHESWERAGAAALRRSVFCSEQGLFAGDDRDPIDAHAIPIVALSLWGVAADAVVGTVRIHEAEPGTWWGSRLAVAERLSPCGHARLLLIRLAVSSAHARGCRRFLAHVQSQNALLFRRLRWRTLERWNWWAAPSSDGGGPYLLSAVRCGGDRLPRLSAAGCLMERALESLARSLRASPALPPRRTSPASPRASASTGKRGAGGR